MAATRSLPLPVLTSSFETDNDVDGLLLSVGLCFNFYLCAGASALRKTSHEFSQSGLPEIIDVGLVKYSVGTEGPLLFQSRDLFSGQAVDDQVAHEIPRSFVNVESIAYAPDGIGDFAAFHSQRFSQIFLRQCLIPGPLGIVP